jgi:hypothetical protein
VKRLSSKRLEDVPDNRVHVGGTSQFIGLNRSSTDEIADVLLILQAEGMEMTPQGFVRVPDHRAKRAVVGSKLRSLLLSQKIVNCRQEEIRRGLARLDIGRETQYFIIVHNSTYEMLIQW